MIKFFSVPFDNNLITLTKESGQPPASYINASLIKFNGFDQEFIAASAPRPNSFENFWQMIIDKKVLRMISIAVLSHFI